MVTWGMKDSMGTIITTFDLIYGSVRNTDAPQVVAMHGGVKVPRWCALGDQIGKQNEVLHANSFYINAFGKLPEGFRRAPGKVLEGCFGSFEGFLDQLVLAGSYRWGEGFGGAWCFWDLLCFDMFNLS